MSSFSMSRRRFALGTAMAAATALVSPDEMAAQTATTATPPAKPIEQQADAAIAKLSPKARAEADMKTTEIFRKYGDRLTEEQKADIRKVMAETQTHDALQKMRSFALENNDQPATVFQAYRREGTQ